MLLYNIEELERQNNEDKKYVDTYKLHNSLKYKYDNSKFKEYLLLSVNFIWWFIKYLISPCDIDEYGDVNYMNWLGLSFCEVIVFFAMFVAFHIGWASSGFWILLMIFAFCTISKNIIIIKGRALLTSIVLFIFMVSCCHYHMYIEDYAYCSSEFYKNLKQEFKNNNIKTNADAFKYVLTK